MATEEHIKAMAEAADKFKADLREKGIHVGLGKPPYCVTCEVRWPCDKAKK